MMHCELLDTVKYSYRLEGDSKHVLRLHFSSGHDAVLWYPSRMFEFIRIGELIELRNANKDTNRYLLIYGKEYTATEIKAYI